MIGREVLTRPTSVLAGLGVIAVVLASLAAPTHRGFGNDAYVIVLIAAGVVAWTASVQARTATPTAALAIILTVALVIRLIAINSAPQVSTDVYRYVWDGRVQGAGINPYRYIPADSHLAFLRDKAIYPKINRADYAHTAYPPVAQMFFFLATRLSDSVLAMRASLVLCEAATIYVIWRLLQKLALPGALVVAYAWHPLAVWEVANGGHVDALITLFVAISLLALTSGRRLIGAAVAVLCVLVKPYAIVLMPAFWRRWDWRAPLLVVAVIVMLYLPYLSVGAGVVGFIPEYLHEERIDSGSAFWVVLLVQRMVGKAPWITPVYVLFGVAAFIFLSLRIMREPETYDPRRQYRDAMLLLAIGLFFLSPNYAWYYLPLIPFAALGGGPAIWMMTIGALVLHGGPLGLGVDNRFIVSKSILNVGWLLALAVPWAIRRHRERKAAA